MSIFYNKKKTCKEDGPKRSYEASINADEVKKTLKKIEIARRMRKHRNQDNWDLEQEFYAWQEAMNQKRDAYKLGTLSAERFLAWLKEHKSYIEDWDYDEE